MQRFLSPSTLAAALFLTTTLLGIVTQPVSADTTGFLALINSYRTQNNLESLSEDQSLTNSACWFANDLGSKNYFPSDHVDSLGRTMAQRLANFGVSDGTRGENIFYTTEGSDANYAFKAWKNSPGHNANMLNAFYTRIGIGHASYSGKWYWTTDFADGTATALTNQCGIQIKPPTPKLTPKPPVSPPPTINSTPAETPIPIETPTAETVLVATESATTSAKVVQIPAQKDTKPQDNKVLVADVFGTSLIVGNFLLFAFILWRLFYRFHLPPIEKEEF